MWRSVRVNAQADAQRVELRCGNSQRLGGFDSLLCLKITMTLRHAEISAGDPQQADDTTAWQVGVRDEPLLRLTSSMERNRKVA